ncbi:MAG: hypothetical protein ACE5R3_06035, partial [Nitrosopumilaceae archaeon]
MLEFFLEQIQSFTPALVLTLGLAIGLQHAFEPDHIAAVTTQISRQKKAFFAFPLFCICHSTMVGLHPSGNRRHGTLVLT